VSLWLGYLIYLGATTVFAVVVAQMATHRALLSGSTHYEVCVVVAWYDFWVGAYYDRKLHRVFMFPIPMVGICVDFDASPLSGGE